MAMRPIVREEMKTCDTVYNALEFAASGAVASNMQLTNTIGTGNSSITRIGKRCIMKAIQIRGAITPSAASVHDEICVMLIYVRSNNLASTLPAWSEILTSQNSISLTNRDNASKFKILRRWNYNVAGSSTSGSNQTSNMNFLFDEYVVFKKPLVAQWKSASVNGTIDEFEKGSLLLCTLGLTNGTGHAALWHFSGESRVYFCESDGYMF